MNGREERRTDIPTPCTRPPESGTHLSMMAFAACLMLNHVDVSYTDWSLNVIVIVQVLSAIGHVILDRGHRVLIYV